MLTPFCADDCVDTKGLCELAEFLLGTGINGLYLCGSTGEGLLMTEAERCLTVETVVNQVRGRVPVIVHVGAPATVMSERLAHHARLAGADAVASIPPFYYAVGKKEIMEHYRRIKQSAGLPLILYNIPGATQVDLGASLVQELYDENIAQGLKYTSYDQLSFREIVESCGPDLNVLAGPDEMLLPFLLMGAQGGIGTTYNLTPELFLSLFAAWQEGDLDQARALQYQVDRVILVIRKYGVVPAVKAAMRMRGVDCGNPRAPLLPLTEEMADKLVDELHQVILQPAAAW